MSDDKVMAVFQLSEKYGGGTLRSLPFSRKWVMRWIVGLLGLMGLMLLALGCSGDSSSSSDRQAQVWQAINSLRVELQNKLGHTVPALSVFVQTPTETVFASSASTQEEAITPDTYFRIASVTKNFTATAVLLMQQNGWLDISHTITTIMPGGDVPYVPDTPDYAIPYKEEISIEQLLQHTAGVYDVDNDPIHDCKGKTDDECMREQDPQHTAGVYDVNNDSVPDCMGKIYDQCMLEHDPDYQFTAAKIVRQVAINELRYFKPGTGYHYSDTGYTLLGEIISRVYSFHAEAEKTYSDFILEQVVGTSAPHPLAITFPYLATDQSMPSPHVCGTVITTDGDKVYCRDNLSAYPANGNGIATMGQLNTFVRTLMRGENVLSPESVALMQNDTTSFNPDYGLGCKRWQYLGYGHKGDQRGYTSIMAYNPETEVSIVVLLPLWDERSSNNFTACQTTLFNAAFETLKVLGYPAEIID